MKFRTEIDLPLGSLTLSHSDKILTLGSCFAENIADKFMHFKFEVFKNPFGVLYNPVSIYNALKIVAEQKTFNHSDLIFNQDEWHSFYHHSNFSHHEPDIVLTNINKSISETSNFLKSAHAVIITFGTSFIYKYKETEQTVSNCHKFPASYFNRQMLSLEEVKDEIKKILDLLTRINDEIKIIFTVSPVRHWKDGATENQLSKAKLLLGIHSFLNEKNISYFPSYEIMIDDLRDYRFYAEDLLHPNKIAIDYIWEKFSRAYFSRPDIKLLEEIEKVVNAFYHRPRNSASPKHQQFVKNNLNLISKLKEELPYINFDIEQNYFERLLI